jgi:hypothetical protein
MTVKANSRCTDSVTLRGDRSAVVVDSRKFTYCEYVFIDLAIQHALTMHHIVICGMPGYRVFSTLSLKLHYFRKKITEQKKAFDFLY